MKKIVFLFVFTALCFSCQTAEKQVAEAWDVNAPLDLGFYSLWPTGLYKMEITDQQFVLKKPQCLDLELELEILNGIQDTTFQNNIVAMDSLPGVSQQCESLVISKRIIDESNNILYLVSRDEKEDKNLVQGLRKYSDHTYFAQFYSDNFDLGVLEEKFSHVFGFRYYTKKQFLKLGRLQHPETFKTADYEKFWGNMESISKSLEPKIARSKEENLLSKSSAWESFEMLKLTLEASGFNPNITQKVAYGLQRHFPQKSPPQKNK